MRATARLPASRNRPVAVRLLTIACCCRSSARRVANGVAVTASRELARAKRNPCPATQPSLVELLKDSDPAVRYWAAVGLGALVEATRGGKPPEDFAETPKALTDASSTVRVAAADALCRRGNYDTPLPVLRRGLQDKNEWVRLAAANALDRINGHARPALAEIEQARKDNNPYVVRVAEHTLVPPVISGRSVAAQLVQALIADAREQGFKVRPDCSYVAAAFQRHPEWADLRA